VADSALQRLIALFNAQVGTKETGENNVIYNTDFYGGAVQGPDFPWCCAFIWDVFRMAGLSGLFCGGAKTAWCPYVVDYARSHGQWVTGDYRPGDLILYDFNGDGLADHIGFCTAVSGTALTAVEGNVDGAVRRMTRTSREVMGACRPAYPSSGSGSSGGERTYIVQPNDTLWNIARDQLGDGSRWWEILELNGLTSALIRPGEVLRLPTAAEPDVSGGKTVPVTLPELSSDARTWASLIC